MGAKLKEVTERWVKRPDGTREKVTLEFPYWALLGRLCGTSGVGQTIRF